MLYGSKTWCLREREISILRTEKAMIRAMCGVELIQKRRSQKLINLLGLKDTLDGVARQVEYDCEGMFGKERWILKCREEEGMGDQI